MSFAEFRSGCSQYSAETGDRLKSVTVNQDGQYIARFASGSMIVGNGVCKRVCVRWGSGHMAYATF